MKPRYVTSWVAERVVDTDDDGNLITEVVLEMETDRGRLVLTFTPEVAANVGWDLIGEGAAFAYNTVKAEGEE